MSLKCWGETLTNPKEEMKGVGDQKALLGELSGCQKHILQVKPKFLSLPSAPFGFCLMPPAHVRQL